MYEAALARNVPTNHVWIYLPEKPAAEKLPCVLVAPAGSRLFHGMSLAEGDRAEHLPYVRQGFAVIAYELDGPMPEEPRGADAIAAAKAFKDSKAGLTNAQAALDYALAKVPQIDPNRIFIAGHSSAATHALLMAASDSRIKGCIAYAPAIDVPQRVGPRNLNPLGKGIEGFDEFIKWSSPSNHVKDVKCPVLLFYAADDDVISIPDIERFGEDLKKSNRDVTVMAADKGGHYDAMIKEGIPVGILWLKSHTKKG